MSRPLTVAVPTYHAGPGLAETLRSIVDQRGPEFDLLVVDDRSTDGTADLARSIVGDRGRVIENPERLGLAGNWNHCAALGRTPLVAIFHQDDLMGPGHLAAHVTTLTADPSLGLAISATRTIDADGRPLPDNAGLGLTDRTFRPGELTPFLAAANPIRCSAVTLRRSAFDEVGGFDPSWKYAVDWEFWLRIGERWPVAWLAGPTVSIRWHAGSETARFRRGTADLDEVDRLTRSLFESPAGRRPEVARRRRESSRDLARAYLNRAYSAAVARDRALSRLALRRALALDPWTLARVAADPRLAWRLIAGSRSGPPPAGGAKT